MDAISIFTKQRDENYDRYLNGMRSLCEFGGIVSKEFAFEDCNLDSIHSALLRFPKKEQVITFFAFGFDGQKAEGIITPEIAEKINASLSEGERSKKSALTAYITRILRNPNLKGEHVKPEVLQKRKEEKWNAFRKKAQTDAANVPVRDVFGSDAGLLTFSGIDTLQDFIDCWEADPERLILECELGRSTNKMLKDLEKLGIKLEKPESILTTKERILLAQEAKQAKSVRTSRDKTRITDAGFDNKKELIKEIEKLSQEEVREIAPDILLKIARMRKRSPRLVAKNVSVHSVDKPSR